MFYEINLFLGGERGHKPSQFGNVHVKPQGTRKQMGGGGASTSFMDANARHF